MMGRLGTERMSDNQDLVCEGEKEVTEEQAIRIVEGWVNTCNTVSILAAGKTGVGKSSLLNAISGGDNFGNSKDRSQEVTKTIESNIFQEHGVIVTAWDTLQDSSDNEEVYKKELKEHCSDIDLLLYCISLKETRSDFTTDVSAFKQITEALTKNIWKRSIVVLTFSNTKERRLKTMRVTDLEGSFKKQVNQHKVQLQEALQEAGVDEAITEKIKFIAAGHIKQKHIPGQQNWILNLWSACVLVTSEKTVLALPQESLNESLEDTLVDTFEKERAKQPITIPAKAILARSAIAGTALGATTGVLIGALGIGIPTFGVGSGVALVVGLVVGGTVGGVLGGGCMMVAKRFGAKR